MAHFRQPHTLPDDQIGGPAAAGRWFVGGASTPDRQALERAAYRDLAGHFDIVAVLQRSSSSVLYDARDIEGDRRVALRAISRTALDPALEERLVRALADAASMDHPNIVAIQRSGGGARVLWYAMEFVEGPSLATILRDHGPLDYRRCLTVVEQTAAALQYAHRRGVVHGDLHPANIFVFGPGWVLVSDFSLGRLLASLPGAEESWAARQRPVYRAPEEEASDLPPSPAADQYALALTAWECLTGASPGAQHEDHSLAARLAELRPDLPPHVRTALQRALRPRPSERFPTVQDFVAALSSAGQAAPVNAAPPRTSEPSPASQRLLFVNYPQRKPARKLIAGAVAAFAVITLGVVSLRGVGTRDAFSPAVPILGPGASGQPAPSPSEKAPASRAAPGPAEPTGAQAALPEAGSQAPDTAASLRSTDRASLDEESADGGVVRDDEPAEPAAPRTQPRTRPPGRAANTSRNAPAPVTQTPEPPPAPTIVPGRLFVSSRPWGQVFVDGQLIGNSPLASATISPGTHVIRVARPGFRSYEREVYVTPGQDVRLVDLVLEAEPR
jgi:serine/threonine protein kinase